MLNFADDCYRAGMNPEARDLVDYLFGPAVAGSHVRSRELVLKAFGLRTHVFWPVFLATWSGCDATWPEKGWRLQLLRRHAARQSARLYMTAQNATAFHGLPPLVRVYRGCARYRVRGISWTTDKDVALKYARGIRFDAEPDRVLAEAVIQKAHVWRDNLDENGSDNQSVKWRSVAKS
jgi:hypothetical protein